MLVLLIDEFCWGGDLLLAAAPLLLKFEESRKLGESWLTKLICSAKSLTDMVCSCGHQGSFNTYDAFDKLRTYTKPRGIIN